MDYLARYNRPADVLSDDALTDAQKEEILRQWRLDALRKADSRAEGMTGGGAPRLAAVDRALNELTEQ